MRKNKYNVDQSDKGKSKRTFNNIIFDSVLEKEYYLYLLAQKESGIIKDIKLQPKFELQPAFNYQGKNIRKIEYIADFKVTYNDNSVIVYDVKGKADATALLKRKLFIFKYPDIKLVWIAYSKRDGGWVDYFEVQNKRRKRKKLAKVVL